jgi:hypothetical protein
MSYIYLDESGDLGFDFIKHKTSKYFVITLLFTKDKERLDKLVKKTFKGFSQKEIQSHSGVLHAHKELPKTKQKLLARFLECETDSVITIYLNKKKVYTNLQNEKHLLYNYVTNILLDRVFTKKLIPTNENINIVASRRETSRFLNKNFTEYITNKIKDEHKVLVKVEIKTPKEEKGLQVVDMLSWSIFRKYEHSDESYYNMIKSKIVEENSLFN